MEITVQTQAQAENPEEGGITLQVSLDLEDVTQLADQAKRALEIERGLPAEARTALADAGERAYVNDFIQTRATNDALEVHNIIPVAIPRVHSTAGLVDAQPFTCYVHVHPRPEIGLTTLDPEKLAVERVAKPGFSLQAGREGSEGVEYVEDDKVLRAQLTEKLDTELSEPAMKALGEEYADKFEAELAKRGMTPEDFKTGHGLDDEQYAIMLTRRALSDAHWNYVLDAVFVGRGFTITEDDLRATFEADFPGFSDALLELHELRNDMYLTVEKFRRAKALDWLRENVLK